MQRPARPPADEIRRLYVDEGLSLAGVAHRVGFSPSWVRNQLEQLGIRRRPAHQLAGTKRIDEAAEADLVKEIRRLYVAEELSLSTIASRLGRSSWWVRQRLARAGVATRGRGGRYGDPVDVDLVATMADLYASEGLTCAQIGERVGMSGSWVRHRLLEAGVSLRHTRRLAVDDGRIRQLYVNERRSMRATAKAVGVSAAVVRRVLVSAGVPLRGLNASRSIDCGTVRRLYVDEQLTTTAIAEQLGVSSSGVSSALQRCGIPRRPLGTELTIDTTTLRQLVDEGMSDAAIGARYDVSTWAVRRRLRLEGIRRPPAKPADTRPSPPAAELQRRYVNNGDTLAEIATAYQVPHATVRRWLKNAGIARRRRRHTPPREERLALTVDLLTELYVEQELTAAEVGRHVGVSKRVVLKGLHSHGIPVRPPGPRRPAAEPVLTQLYADPSVVSALNRNQIPIVATPGPSRDRFPEPEPLTAPLLTALYVDVGLSAAMVSLLTGHSEQSVRSALQQSGIAARNESTRSPWSARQMRNP